MVLRFSGVVSKFDCSNIFVFQRYVVFRIFLKLKKIRSKRLPKSKFEVLDLIVG